jgi:hypothetical protein
MRTDSQPTTRFCPRIICLAALLISAPCLAQDAPANIPETKITALEADLPRNDKRTSTLRKRRAYKAVIRDAEGLLDSSPDAPNRYRVLGVLLHTHKLLLTLESSDRNRDTLADICRRLTTAPDDYAETRLEADLLLSEIQLSQKNADVTERTAALAKLIQRYRDTPAELKSLMMALQIAPKLDAFDLEDQIMLALTERFAHNLDVVEWRRDRQGHTQFHVTFAGTYTRVDGTELTFPIDGIGHTCVLYFWSQETPDIETHLAPIKELQSTFPGQIDVFSFNLDELPDAGEKMLRDMGLDWTAMRLPGGRNSQAYRVFATRDPHGLRVNAHGRAILPALMQGVGREGVQRVEELPMEQNFDDPRYLSQLQSLLNGDFLVADSEQHPGGDSVPTETHDAIQACFVPAPLRYRLTRAEALANYKKADALCSAAITQYPKAPDLWRVRNRRITALLGIANLEREPKQLEAVAQEARAALAATLPPGADVVPRFCLAKQALRQGESIPDQVLSDFIDATGAADAPASAYAAAAMLALYVNSRDLHETYRELALAKHIDNPMIWPVTSFLLDQNHRYRLFKANLYSAATRRTERGRLRGNATKVIAQDAHGTLEAEFKTLTGDAVNLPEATDGKLTLLMFVEPPADPQADFPTLINGHVTEDAKGNKREHPGAMQTAFQFVEQYADKGLKVIAAFLSDDSERVQALMKKIDWPCQALMVPGGLRNPIVQRLGILSADRAPNAVLLQPDGKILWKLSGIQHPQLMVEIGEQRYVMEIGMKTHIERFESKRSTSAAPAVP